MGVRTRRVIVLGSTGSIGRQTLEVIAHLNTLADRGESDQRFDVVGLAARSSVQTLSEQHREHPDARLAVVHPDVRDLALGEGTEAFPGALLQAYHGDASPEQLVRDTPCDLVVAAMVGFAGVPATLAAIELGRTVALANKETLVAAGGLITHAARASNVPILPIDSEHAGVWQALLPRGEDVSSRLVASPPLVCGPGVARVTITASGGPFRTWSKERIDRATPEEALNHPTWRMGPKVTIDSASLMNKALELIEAHWLFGLEADRLSVLVHPQSLVHAIVEWRDGTMNAQLAPTDMRSPIQAALTFPHLSRASSGWGALDLASRVALEFEPPDLARFPALALGFRAIREGGAAGTVLNAANEAGVEAFLRKEIAFPTIASLAAGAMDAIGGSGWRAASMDDVRAADAAAREWTRTAIRDRAV